MVGVDVVVVLPDVVVADVAVKVMVLALVVEKVVVLG